MKTKSLSNLNFQITSESSDEISLSFSDGELVSVWINGEELTDREDVAQPISEIFGQECLDMIQGLLNQNDLNVSI